jgi:outer membrane protein assembly factor BamB
MKTTRATLALAAAALLSGGDWTSFRNGGSGTTTERVSPGSLALLWSAQLPGSGAGGSPVVYDSRLYLGGADGALHCLDAATGAELWSFATGASIEASPAYYKGRLYVGSTDGTIYALHATTGALLWSVYHGGTQTGSPIAAAIPGPRDALFVPTGYPTSQLRAYDAIDGTFLWSAALGQPITSTPVYDPTGTPKVIASDNNGLVQAFDATNGAPLWTSNYQGKESNPVVSGAVGGGRFYLCGGCTDRDLHFIDAATGIQATQVQVAPPGFSFKAAAPGTFDPDALYDLMAVGGDEREQMLLDYARQYGTDPATLRALLDQLEQEPAPSPPPDGSSQKALMLASSRVVSGSSVALWGNLALLTHRELPGSGNDSYYTVAIDVSSASVVWGTPPVVLSAPPASFAPTPAVDAGGTAYYAHRDTLYAADAATGATIGSVNLAGDPITGGPVLANGRIYVTTMKGQVVAYAGANTPPTAPTTFDPSGGVNITSTSTPTLSWSGQSDAETTTPSLVSHVEFDFGWENADLETSLTKTSLTLAPGTSSYLMSPALPASTHVFWRVRIQDADGALSAWSAVQDFWVNRDDEPPEPPGSLSATPADASVKLDWTPSSSADVTHYRLRYKEAGAGWASATLVDNLSGTSTTVGGLVNGTTYDFALTAVDVGENESAAVLASATPEGLITINGVGTGYGTIQEALNAALPGDVVLVGEGTFTENPIVPPGVGLRGAGPGLTILLAAGSGPVLSVGGTYGIDPSSEIGGLTIGSGASGIDAGDADVWIHHVLVHGMTGDAIVGSAAGQLLIQNVTLTSNGGTGVRGAGSLTVVDSSIIDANGGYGVELPAGAEVRYSDLYGNVLGDVAGSPTLTGNISAAPIYADGAYHEDRASPTVDAGNPALPYDQEPDPDGGRINQGAYGNTAEATSTSGGGGGGSGGCSIAGLSAGGTATIPALALFVAALAALRRRR